MVNNYSLHYYKPYKSISFTLIEITMTILIVSIITTYAITRLADLNGFKTVLFFKQVHSSLTYAQDMAMSSGCHIAINVTLNSLELKLRNSCQSGDFLLNIQDPFYRKDYYIQNAPNNVNLATNNFPIYFDHNGQARLTSTNNVINANLTITGKNLQETIYINGENGSINNV